MADQRGRIVAWLRQHGRTSCHELAHACDVPSVTKRVSELRRMGWPIVAHRGHVLTRTGAERRATFYELQRDHAQRDLFEPRA